VWSEYAVSARNKTSESGLGVGKGFGRQKRQGVSILGSFAAVSGVNAEARPFEEVGPFAKFELQAELTATEDAFPGDVSEELGNSGKERVGGR